MRGLISVLAAASLAAFAAGPSVSSAASSSKNDITFRGTGKYTVHYVLRTGEAFSVTASFRFKTVFLGVLFAPGGSGRSFSSIAESSYGGTWEARATVPRHVVVCGGTGKFGNPALSTPRAQLRYLWNAGTGEMTIRVFAFPRNELPTISRHANDCAGELPNLGIAVTAANDFWADWVEGFSELGGPKNDVLSAKYSFPSSVLENKDVKETVSAKASNMPASCRHARYRTCTQSYDWTGSVTYANDSL